MKVSQLQPGDLFKQKGQRKFRQVGRNPPLLLDSTNITHEPSFGKILVVLDNCGQLLFDADDEVITPN